MRLFKKLNPLLIALLFAMIGGQATVFAQSNIKEGNNFFAMYTKDGDFKNLEQARKFADNAYKERRDSSSYDNNLLRALVYSSLSVADSNRKLKYSKDPIEEAELALSKLTDKQLNFENAPQLTYINRKLANANLILATRAIKGNKTEDALNYFKEVDRLSEGDIKVKYNLSVLSSKLGRHGDAVNYYKQYLETSGPIKVADVLLLSDLYAKAGNNNEQLNTLLNGRDYFPEDKNILFKIINIYAANGSYDAIVPLVDEAYRLEPESIELNYLAGYAYEVTGNQKLAEQYFKNVINLDDNNYNANYELGLLYLRDFVKNTSNVQSLELAEKYLLKANEIDPNSVNALKSLAILFGKSGDTLQYERVRNQLNQNIFN